MKENYTRKEIREAEDVALFKGILGTVFAISVALFLTGIKMQCS